MQFWSYLVIRFVQAIFVTLLVVTIVFVVSRTVGNPEETMLPPLTTTPEDKERFRELLGLNDALHVQYGNFLLDLLQGDFGTSWRGGGTSTLDAIGDRALNTVKLGVAGVVFALALAVPLGIIAALRRGSTVDWLARFVAVIGQATPSFWLGLMMIFFFSVQLGWFPTGGREGGLSLADPARDRVGSIRAGRDHAVDPFRDDRGDGHRFRPHGEGQGSQRADCDLAPRCASRVAAGRDDARTLAGPTESAAR